MVPLTVGLTCWAIGTVSTTLVRSNRHGEGQSQETGTRLRRVWNGETFYSPNSVDGKRRSTGRSPDALHLAKGAYAGLVCALSFPLNCICSSHHPGRLVFSPPASLSFLISISPLQKPGNAFRNNQSVNLGVTLPTWVSLADRWMSINSPRGLNDLMNSGDTLPI
jgi:hypothetical protein